MLSDCQDVTSHTALYVVSVRHPDDVSESAKLVAGDGSLHTDIVGLV